VSEPKAHVGKIKAEKRPGETTDSEM